MPAPEQPFIAANAAFFGADVTGWGEPGNAAAELVSTLDAPLARDFPANKPQVRET